MAVKHLRIGRNESENFHCKGTIADETRAQQMRCLPLSIYLLSDLSYVPIQSTRHLSHKNVLVVDHSANTCITYVNWPWLQYQSHNVLHACCASAAPCISEGHHTVLLFSGPFICMDRFDDHGLDGSLSPRSITRELSQEEELIFPVFGPGGSRPTTPTTSALHPRTGNASQSLLRFAVRETHHHAARLRAVEATGNIQRRNIPIPPIIPRIRTPPPRTTSPVFATGAPQLLNYRVPLRDTSSTPTFNPSSHTRRHERRSNIYSAPPTPSPSQCSKPQLYTLPCGGKLIVPYVEFREDV
ncbi:hypothetical protein R3P38DRAFT_1315281 [Favolaschia claudopus]|uniref:Uncharacterized protein n=1 Tax=Favolaschia claudopus TaxID=2862362 RepID=A0AAW0AYF0_9AGAR